MKVNPRDGKCRSCGGELDIIEVDDATMTVVCSSCSDIYEVEQDAFNDGCMHYAPGFLMEQTEGGDDL
jgi:ssDNA-binding Zn-finger/Zn-ribbon topoisomerase 1